MCLGLCGVESTLILGSSHLTFPAEPWGRLSRGLKVLFTNEETNTQRIMLSQSQKKKKKRVCDRATPKLLSSLLLGGLKAWRVKQSEVPKAA